MAYCGSRGLALSEFLRWSDKDQAAALDWQAYESRRCKNCGTHPDDVADGSFHAHAEQCKGCQHRQRVAESLKDEEQRGVFAVALPYAAIDCERCRPHDD